MTFQHPSDTPSTDGEEVPVLVVTKRSYQVSGGSLTLELDTDHPLDASELEALERIAIACRQYSAEAPRRFAEPFDLAIEELGGEENICAG